MNTEIVLTLGVLAVTVLLLLLDAFRVDIIAILVMLSLAWLKLVSPQEAFSGFASNAVIAIIGVLILGYGIDRSGAMIHLTQFITRAGGTSERRLIAVMAGSVGILSPFIQNIGVAALFLPSVLMISRTRKISASRLMMPLGFTAIIGGTLSMVASGPLIILNDLLLQGGQVKYGLFDVTPLGLLLYTSGTAYFLLLGRHVLPDRGTGEAEPDAQKHLVETWHLPSAVHQCRIPAGSPMVDKTREEVRFRSRYNLHLLALAEKDEVQYSPWRYTRFAADQVLRLLGETRDVERLAADYRLQYPFSSKKLRDCEIYRECGFAEVIVPPLSPFIGKSIREIALRKTYGVEPILLMHGAKEERQEFADQALQPGDTLIIHGRWENLKALGDNRICVLVTPIEREAGRNAHPILAVACFLVSIVLAILGFQLSLSLMTGALAMILLRVVSIDEAYRAVDWRTVFLLAGLIPVGIAMEHTGTAAYLSGSLAAWLQGAHVTVLLTAVAVLTTMFSLFMSNVAATVLLVPLVMRMADQSGADPRGMALLVAVCASNSFLLPTHQVNALLMSPGGYRTRDYLKAGAPMTVIFMVIAVAGIYWIYL
jgi:di/tricarboxylate transporter